MKKEEEDEKLLRKAGLRVKAFKKKNAYELQTVDCCLTCENAEFGYECELSCYLMRDERWSVNEVSYLALCRQFKISE